MQDNVANIILVECKNIGAYIYKKAMSGSIYIKFNKKCGSLRVGDHKGREKYRYKWEIRIDKEGKSVRLDRGVIRRVYGADSINKMIEDIKIYCEILKE